MLNPTFFICACIIFVTSPPSKNKYKRKKTQISKRLKKKIWNLRVQKFALVEVYMGEAMNIVATNIDSTYDIKDSMFKTPYIKKKYYYK